MVLIGRRIVEVGAGIAASGDNHNLIELTKKQDRVEKRKHMREEFGEREGESGPEERVGVERHHEEADVI